MLGRVVAVFVIAVVTGVLAVAVSGERLFTNAPDDRLVPVDAVVVLGGQHDGREQYGIELARRAGASAVLLSNPYPEGDAIMAKLCGSRSGRIEVLCGRPMPATTRGEAKLAHRIGTQKGWRTIAVVTWRYHLFRARTIFKQCFDRQGDDVIMQAVPGEYSYSAAVWQYVYTYQYLGLVKTWAQGDCTQS